MLFVDIVFGVLVPSTGFDPWYKPAFVQNVMAIKLILLSYAKREIKFADSSKFWKCSYVTKLSSEDNNAPCPKHK